MNKQLYLITTQEQSFITHTIGAYIVNLSQVSNTTTTATANPNYVLYGAIIAAGAALIVAVFGNFWANSREYDKWRREELTKQIFAVQDVLTEIKESINNGSYLPRTATQHLYKLSDNTFRISMLVEHKFDRQYSNIVNALVEIIRSNQYTGQELRNKITEQQATLTNQAQKELKRKTPGPFKFMLGIALLIVFLPLFVVALLFRWHDLVNWFNSRPVVVQFRADWRTYRDLKKQQKLHRSQAKGNQGS